MKLLFALLIPLALSAQVAVRIDPAYGYALPQSPFSGSARPLGTQPGSRVWLCNNKQAGNACTSFTTTYTDSTATTVCAPAQFTGQQQSTNIGTSTCSSVFGPDGNFGFWVLPSSSPLWFSFQVPGAQAPSGPYPVSTSGAGTGGGISGLTNDVTTTGSTGIVPAKVVAVQGIPVSSATPANGQTLTYNGSQYVPSTIGGGISALTGDVAASGTGSVNASVNGIRGITVSAVSPLLGQSLFFNGTAWIPSSISVTWPLQSTGGAAPTFSVPVTSNYAADSGTLNAYAAALSPAPSSYASGMVVYLYPSSTNTSSIPTLNVSGLGALQIQKGTPSGLSTLAASDILTGVPAEFIYRLGGVWVLLNPQTASASGACTGCLAEPSSGAGVVAASVGSTATQVVNLVVGVGANTNIAATTANCPASPTICNIQIPATYTGSDQLQGFTQNYTVADQSTYASNVVFDDFRTGNSWSVSGNCLYATFSCSYFSEANVVTSFPQLVTGAHFHKNSLMAGGSFQTTNFTNYVGDFYPFFSKTPGQAQVMDLQALSTTGNDMLLRSDSLNCVGYRGVPGFNEGCEAQDLLIYQGLINYGSGDWEGTSGTTGTGVHTLNISTPTQLSRLFGPNRDIINLTAGPAYTTTVSSFSCPGSAPCTVTVAATVPVSPAYGSVAAAVTATGPQAVTPTLMSGTVSNFSTSQLVCIAEPMGEPERIYPSAVGTTTVTLNFNFLHAAGYLIYTGGLCGYDFDAAQDDATATSFPNMGNASAGGVSGTSIVGTAHRPFFIAGTTGSHNIVVDYHEGFWPNFAGNTNLQNGGTVNIWVAASVLAIGASPGLDSGYSGGNVTLADNFLTVGSGQTLAQPMGPTMRITYGNCNFINLWGNNANTGGSSHGCNFGGIMTYNDSFESASNFTPPAFYTLGGGTRSLPEYTFGFSSPALYQNLQGYTGQNADIAFAACYQAYFSGSCNDPNHIVIQEPNSGTGLAADYFGYNQATETFFVTENNGTTRVYLNGSASLPTTGTTNGQYAPIATVTGGAATNTYTATLITPLPSCSAMGTSYTVTGATNASPIVVTTSAANGLYANEWVNIASVGGNTAANGLFQITVLTSTTFSLNSSTGNAAYTSGGTALNASSGPCINSDGTSGIFTYVDKQSGTTYTIPTSDAGALVIYTGTANATGWVIPQAATGSNFPVGKSLTVRANSSGTITLTPSSGTIGGASNLTVSAGKACGITSAAASDYELSQCN